MTSSFLLFPSAFLSPATSYSPLHHAVVAQRGGGTPQRLGPLFTFFLLTFKRADAKGTRQRVLTSLFQIISIINA